MPRVQPSQVGARRLGPHSETRWTLRVDTTPERPVLSAREVRAIRRQYERGISPTVIAEDFGITIGHVCNIGAGRRRQED